MEVEFVSASAFRVRRGVMTAPSGTPDPVGLQISQDKEALTMTTVDLTVRDYLEDRWLPSLSAEDLDAASIDIYREHVARIVRSLEDRDALILRRIDELRPAQLRMLVSLMGMRTLPREADAGSPMADCTSADRMWPPSRGDVKHPFSFTARGGCGPTSRG